MEKIVIQSDIDNIKQVECFVDSVCDQWNIYNYAATITISLIQAVENAIVHGNKNDINKHVTISCYDCLGGVAFSVEDEGTGFDYSVFTDVPKEEGRGTGLFLMRTLSDKIAFYNQGSKVTMEFMINGIEKSRALERISVLKKYFIFRQPVL